MNQTGNDDAMVMRGDRLGCFAASGAVELTAGGAEGSSLSSSLSSSFCAGAKAALTRKVVKGGGVGDGSVCMRPLFRMAGR